MLRTSGVGDFIDGVFYKRAAPTGLGVWKTKTYVLQTGHAYGACIETNVGDFIDDVLLQMCSPCGAWDLLVWMLLLQTGHAYGVCLGASAVGAARL